MTRRENGRNRWIAVAEALVFVAALAGLLILMMARAAEQRDRDVARGLGRDAGGVAPLGPDRPALRQVAAQPGDGPHSASGTVIDAAGAAVPGVVVTATSERGPSTPVPAPRDAGVPDPAVVAVADENGAFTLVGLDLGRYRLRVDGEGIFSAEVRYVAVPNRGIRLVVARQVELRGTVLDGGEAVPGIEVDVSGFGAACARRTQTDAQGQFHFGDLAEGVYRLWAASGDRASPAVRAALLGAGPFDPVVLELGPAAVVTGRVVDRKSERGMAAAVTLVSDSADEPQRYGRSGADGNFRIEGIPHGRWTADAYAPGYLSTEAVSFEVGKGYAPTLLLSPGGIVSGTVVNLDGVPIAGAAVAIRGKDESDRSTALSQATRRERAARATGGGGGAGFVPGQRFIPRGELGVLLGPIPFPPPRGAASVHVASIVDEEGGGGDAGDDRPLVVPPELRSSFITDEQGRFRIAGLPQGRFRADANHRDYADGSSKPFGLGRGQALGGLRIVLVPGVVLFGTVENDANEVIVGATVVADFGADRDQTQRLQAVTGVDGRYRLGPIASDVELRVTAVRHGHVTRKIVVGKPRARVEEREEDFVLPRANAVLSGRVSDPAGFPVRDARVLLAARDRLGSERSSTTDEHGNFAIDGLTPGAHELRVEHADFPVLAAAAETDVPARLVVAFGGGIEAEVRDAHTSVPMAGVRVIATGPDKARRELLSGEDGAFELVPIAAGAWKLTVSASGYAKLEREVRVAAGKRPRAITVRGLRIGLERGATIAGIVRDQNGDRVRGANVRVGEVSAKTDENGRFEIKDVPTGDTVIEALHGDKRGQLRIPLSPGDELVTLQILVAPPRGP